MKNNCKKNFSRIQFIEFSTMATLKGEDWPEKMKYVRKLRCDKIYEGFHSDQRCTILVVPL